MPPAGSSFGLLAATTSLVATASRPASRAGIRETDPSNSLELNVPFALAVLPVPFRFTTRREPSSITLIAEGNQPVGIDPMTDHFVPARLTTAIAFVPAHAT